MTRTLVALFAALLILPGASFQEDDKERQKAETKRREDDAKAALKSYRDRFRAAKSADERIEAVQSLESAEPHPLIRAELARVLETDGSIDVRIAAAGALGKFKRDAVAADILLRNAKGQKDEGLKKTCIRKYGSVAPFGKSTELRVFFNEENNELVKEAVESIEAINSIRMIKPLVELLAELENIREDKGESGSGGPPLPGGAPPGESSNQQRIKRKKELTGPVRKAINSIWKKYDSQTKLNNSTDAFNQLQRNQSFLKKIQETEDREDKGIKADSAGEMK